MQQHGFGWWNTRWSTSYRHVVFGQRRMRLCISNCPKRCLKYCSMHYATHEMRGDQESGHKVCNFITKTSLLRITTVVRNMRLDRL